MVGSYIGENVPVRNELVKHDFPTARYPNKATFLDTTVGCFELLFKFVVEELLVLVMMVLLGLCCMFDQILYDKWER